MKIITTVEPIENLKDEWEQLMLRVSHPSLFLTWEWIFSWCQTMVAPHEHVMIITARIDNRLAGIAPLIIRHHDQHEKSVHIIGQAYSYYLGFPAETGIEEAIYHSLMNHLFDSTGFDFNSLEFKHLAENEIFNSVLHEQAQQRNLAYEKSIQNPCRVISLSGSYSEYANSGVSSVNLKKRLKYRLRKLEKEFDVGFTIADEGNFDEIWAELLKLHRETMASRRKHSVLMDDAFPKHLEHVAKEHLKDNTLRLYKFSLNNVTAAVVLAIIHNREVNGLTLGLNHHLIGQVPNFNLAIYSQIYCIKSAISEGWTAYDFMGGSSEYKVRMGGQERGGIKITISKPVMSSSALKPIAIFCNAYLDPKQPDRMKTGGVEVWMSELINLLADLGFAPVIYQNSAENFVIRAIGAEVMGLGNLDRHKMNRLSHFDAEKRGIKWIIYARSFVGEKYFKPGNIFIQHGIHWDYTTSADKLFERLKWERIRRRLSSHDLRMCREAKLTISVDTNFLNYSRVMLKDGFDPHRMRYIPNFAVPQEKSTWEMKWKAPEVIHIVFARRFELRRGSLIFADAITQLLQSLPNIRITLAGCGTYETLFREKFSNDSRVITTEIQHEQMYQLLNTAHIAVIPSTYSEGTSLSCLEAMASGCAVIASDVGGLGNIVMPDYNGILIRPVAGDIVTAVTRLASDLNFAKLIAGRGFDIVKNSFSLSLWKKRIRQALEEAGIS